MQAPAAATPATHRRRLAQPPGWAGRMPADGTGLPKLRRRWVGKQYRRRARRAAKCGLYRSAYRGSRLQAAYISTTNSAATTCLTVGGSPDNEQESEEGAGLPSEVAGLSDARKVGSADLVQTLQSSQHRYSGPACSWLKHGWGTNLPPRGALPSCAAAGTEPTCTPCPCPLPYWRLQKNARHTRHAPSK